MLCEGMQHSTTTHTNKQSLQTFFIRPNTNLRSDISMTHIALSKQKFGSSIFQTTSLCPANPFCHFYKFIRMHLQLIVTQSETPPLRERQSERDQFTVPHRFRNLVQNKNGQHKIIDLSKLFALSISWKVARTQNTSESTAGGLPASIRIL